MDAHEVPGLGHDVELVIVSESLSESEARANVDRRRPSPGSEWCRQTVLALARLLDTSGTAGGGSGSVGLRHAAVELLAPPPSPWPAAKPVAIAASAQI